MSEPDRKNSVVYIVGFAAAICLACAVVVASAAVGLKPLQDKNAKVDRLTKVLGVAGLVKPDEKLDAEEVLKRFDENIVAKAVRFDTGEYDDSIDAASYNQRAAASDPERSEPAPDNGARVTRLPHHGLVFQVVEGEEVKQLILPIQGYGLWSTMYGYIALESDAETVTGITFYEHGETPGLGGEIENETWQAKWKGRKAFGADGEVALQVIKGPAGPAESAPYSIDGLSGATITSRGVTATLEFWLGENGFGPYLDKFRGRRTS